VSKIVLEHVSKVYPGDVLAVEQDPFPPAGGGIGHFDRPHPGAIHFGFDLESGAFEPCHLLVRRAANGPEQDRVVDGFEQVGLALGIGAKEDQAGRGGLTVEVRQVAEPSSHQVAEPHYSMRICRLTGVPWSPSRSTP